MLGRQPHDPDITTLLARLRITRWTPLAARGLSKGISLSSSGRADPARTGGQLSALPPLYFLHVWWAKRPLTPSRAATLAALDPANASADGFIRPLGIERVQTLVNGQPWTLTGKLLERIETRTRTEWLPVDSAVLATLTREQQRHAENRERIETLRHHSSELTSQHWDVVLIDEAHLRGTQKRHQRPTPLRRTLPNPSRTGLRPRTKALWLATATPMQLDPIQIYDLFQLTRRVGPFLREPSLTTAYYELQGRLQRRE